MVRTILILLIGVLIGATSAYFIGSHFFTLEVHPVQGRVAGTGSAADQTDPGNLDTAEFADHSGTHEGRQAFYRRVTQAGEAELLAMIEDAAGIGESHARRVATEILLSRYAEIDPGGAIKLSRARGVGRAITASLYASWARSDQDAALDALRGESDPAIARQAAVLLVEELGGDSTALLDVIDALPPHVEKLGVEIGVLVAQSSYDPVHSISQAGTFEHRGLRKRALKSIARHLASQDPQQAISAGSQITDSNERLAYQVEVMREWASADPAAVLDYLEVADFSGTEMQSVAPYIFATLGDADPERLLAASEQWPPVVAERARRSALHRWSMNDPQSALQFVEEQPRGRKRDELLNTIARGYGRTDPEAALAWAHSLQPAPYGVYRSVINGLAEEDPERAFDIALGLESEQAQAEALNSVVSQAAYRGADIRGMADRILTHDSDLVRENIIQMFGYSWARYDPSGAISWIARNSDRLPGNSFDQIARQIADREPQIAADLTSQVPADRRAAWIQQVARGFARSDPEKAMNWLSQYQGQPGYDRAVGGIAQETARSDPVAAARSIETHTDPNHAAVVAATAGGQWAERDPQSAAQWAENIQNEQVRNAAVTNVARRWAHSEPDNAARWVMTLPAGPARDDALRSVVSGIAGERVPDQELLAAFSSDMARQEAAVMAAYRLARSDRAAADRLVRQYVTDPALRYRAEQQLDSLMH